MVAVKSAPMLAVLRFSDNEGYPLPEPDVKDLPMSCPSLRYVLWEVQGKPTLYGIAARPKVLEIDSSSPGEAGEETIEMVGTPVPYAFRS